MYLGTLATISRSNFGLMRAGIVFCTLALHANSVAVADPEPDATIASIYEAENFGALGDISAFAFGTEHCNQGDADLQWNGQTGIVVGQNMFRLKNNRFEQIGQSWAKYGAIVPYPLPGQSYSCGGTETCEYVQGADGSVLFAGCNDAYQAAFNGSRSELGPKNPINPVTGWRPSDNTPPCAEQDCDIVEGRLQVHSTEIGVNGVPSGTFFVEAQIIAGTETLPGTRINNASHDRVTFEFNGGAWDDPTLQGEFVPEQPAIHAWKAIDSSVVETVKDVSGDGRFILAAKATHIGWGLYDYEYALYNMNSHRAAKSFSVPVPQGVCVINIGFHDVDYHSGEVYDDADWVGTLAGGTITWTTPAYPSDPDNANALRWGTLYNFRFRTDVPPVSKTATIELFEDGSPSSVPAATIGPKPIIMNGACCILDEGCLSTTICACEASGGLYYPGKNCNQVFCPQ